MISQAEIRALAEEEGFPRVTIYMPTHKVGGRELRQEPIRLKNLLREAAEGLQKQDFTSLHIDELFASVRSRIDDEAFWQHQEDGLAIFISQADTRYVRAPLSFDEQVHVGRRFVVKPLLPLLARDGTFFVLSAEQEEAVLFRASRYSMSEIEDDRIPRSAARALNKTVFEGSVGFHPTSGGHEGAQFHALGESPQDEAQEQVREFVGRIARAVDEILSGENAPLVLAADDRLLGMLRGTTKYKHVIEEGIREHPTALGKDALHQRAYELVRPQLDSERREAIERLVARLKGGDAPASDRIDDIAKAAAEGRIDTLIIPVNGTDGRAGGQGAPETYDILDRAVLDTLSHGGAVFSQPAERPRDVPEVGAIFRY